LMLSKQNDGGFVTGWPESSDLMSMIIMEAMIVKQIQMEI
jgi:hypothetical protein